MKKLNLGNVVNAILSVLLVVAAICCVGMLVFKMRATIDDVAKSEAKIETLQNEVKNLKEEQEKVGMLKLSCSDTVLKYSAINGVNKEALSSLEVTTPYPSTLYQVIDKEGKVLQNNKFEAKGNKKLNKFKIEGITDEVEIRLLGFNEKGNQVVSQEYNIVFLN